MKVLVTGGLGHLGRYVSKEILESGHDLTILAHRSKKFAKLFPSECIIWGDICRPETYRHLIPDQDAVIHLSFMDFINSEIKPWAYEVNVGGTKQLINEIEEINPGCRFIFSSSVSVFGDTRNEMPPIGIDHPISPIDNYGRHKVECEKLIKKSKLNWVILRIAQGFYLDVSPTLKFLKLLYSISWDQRVTFIHLKDTAILASLSAKRLWPAGVSNPASAKGARPASQSAEFPYILRPLRHTFALNPHLPYRQE